MALDDNSVTAAIWKEYFEGGIGRAVYSNSDENMMQFVLEKFSNRGTIHSKLEELIDSTQIDDARALVEQTHLRFIEMWSGGLRL